MRIRRTVLFLAGLVATALPTSSASGYSPAAFTISGKIEYVDQLYDNTQTLGIANRPSRHVTVEFYEKDVANLTKLGSTTTNGTGNYQFQVSDNVDRLGSSGRDITIVVVTDSQYAAVENDWFATHAFKKNILTDHVGGSVVKNVRIPSASSGAFNIYDTLVAGYSFANQFSVLPKVTAVWRSGYLHNTEYNTANSRIYIDGGYDDNGHEPDQYDDDVILHEYGHFLAHKLSCIKPGSTGGHDWQYASDETTAWVEGWASFFSNIARDSKYLTDHKWDGSAPAAYDVELPIAMMGADVEGNVNAVLWDVVDAQNEGADALSVGVDSIWSVFTGYMRSSNTCTLRDFYNGWTSKNSALTAQLDAILAGREIVLNPLEMTQQWKPKIIKTGGWTADVATTPDGKAVFAVSGNRLLRYTPLGVLVFNKPLPAAMTSGGKMAVTSEGVYVAGPGGLVKMDLAGNKKWFQPQVKYYSTFVGVAVDPGTKAVYTVGQNATSYFLIRKYSLGGVLAWSRAWRPVGSTWACGKSVAVDKAGGIIAVGNRNGSAGFLAKYDASGKRIWDATLHLDPSEVALGTDGSIYAAGSVPGWYDPLSCLAKHSDADGKEIWNVRPLDSYYDADVAFGVSVSPLSGDIFVVGAGDESATARDIKVSRVSPDGSVLWLKAIAKKGSQAGLGIFAARDGGLYVAGSMDVIDAPDALWLMRYR